jgi:hypothetical protein
MAPVIPPPPHSVRHRHARPLSSLLACRRMPLWSVRAPLVSMCPCLFLVCRHASDLFDGARHATHHAGVMLLHQYAWRAATRRALHIPVVLCRLRDCQVLHVWKGATADLTKGMC